MRIRTMLLLLTIAVAMAVSAGCVTESSSGPRLSLGENEGADATAVHLHEVAGRLLMYASLRGKMPAKLSDVDEGLQGSKLPNFQPSAIDPANSKPFVYSADGAPAAGLPGKLIIYQSVATGPGGRWALLISDQGPRGRMVIYVQRIPESALQIEKPD